MFIAMKKYDVKFIVFSDSSYSQVLTLYPDDSFLSLDNKIELPNCKSLTKQIIATFTAVSGSTNFISN